MRDQGLSSWLVALVTMVLAGSPTTARELMSPSFPMDQQTADTPPAQLIIGGKVRRVLGSGVFILEDRQAVDGELLVLSPDAEATPVAGAAVIARGVMRRFDQGELEQIHPWREVDEVTRAAFAVRPILLATSLTTASGRSLMPSRSAAARRFDQSSPVVSSRQPTALQLHAASLAELIEEVGGRPVVLPRARVLAVINPRALLIESASPLTPTIGNLDRVLVLLDRAALRVDAAAMSDATVRVVGIARTLLGVQVTREVAWPPELTPEMVKRLEIRAAVLATSVHTADGVELISRQTEP